MIDSSREQSVAIESRRSRAVERSRLLAIAFAILCAGIVRAEFPEIAASRWAESEPPIRFESRDWADDVLAGATNSQSIAVVSGRLQSNTTWNADKTHLVLGTVYVPSGVTLTITAGAVVKFCPATCIKVEDGGKLVLSGALGNEVVLEGYDETTAFDGIRLQSSSAQYSDNCYVIGSGFAFEKFATVSISDTSTFLGAGQALVPVNVSGSRDTAFSFDWVAETNGVQFASGTMSWSRVSDGTKNIAVPFTDGLPGCTNFVVRATTLRCCTASKGMGNVALGEYVTAAIATHEAMAGYVRFESRDWADDVLAGATNSQSIAVESGRLQSNTTWNADKTHLVLGTVYVPSGVTLTIAAGAVVKFCPGTMIKVEDGGKLNVVGADGKDVILTAANDGTVGEIIAGFDAEQSIAFDGIRLQSSAAGYADNCYVIGSGFAFEKFATVSISDTSTFLGAGQALVPVNVSGSRDTAFSFDWVAETNGISFASGTMNWSRVSDGTKNIAVPFTDGLSGCTNFVVRATTLRCCTAGKVVGNVALGEYVTADIATHEAMADYVRFESRDWADDVLAGATNSQSIAVESGRLQSNTTWNADKTHLVLGTIYVPSGVTLTITAGAVVKFCPGTCIKVEDGGKLNVVGADGKDVILTAANDDTVGEVVGGFDPEQSIAFDGIRLQSSSASFTDNGWLETRAFNYGAYPTLTLHEAITYREAGKIYIPVTLSGTTRNQSFNIDWRTDKGDAGTLTWSSSSDGTKWIQVPLDADPVGGTTNHLVAVTAARGCNVAVGEATLTVMEPDYIVTGMVTLNESDEDSGEFAVSGDVRTQPLFFSPVETIQYSGKWQAYDANEAAVLRVTIETDNGVSVLREVSPSETGAFDLNLSRYPVGYYTLRHDILDAYGDTLATMQKSFSIVDDEYVELHGGTLTQNEIWTADKVHVVYETVVVPSIYTIFIEPGAIVKFMTGTGIDISQGGAFFANRIVFAHIDDDTVGGDTLSDGFTVAPPMDAYFLKGAFTFGDDTELRGITQNNALTGTIATQKTLSRGSTYRVSGTLTIASGGSLTIPPGTILKMEDKAAIVVNSGATLNALGTRASPIVITSIKDDTCSGDTNGDGDKTSPQPGDWVKIGVNGGTANFEFTSILYSSKNQTTGAINQNGGVVRFVNSEIAHGLYDAVGVESGNFYMTNSVIRDCLLAFRHWAKDPIVNSVIYDCGRLTQGGGQTFVNCVFAGIDETWEAFGFPKSTYRNCVFWNEGGSVLTGEGTQDAMAVCGADGNIWGDPFFVDPDNGDFRIVEGSPCVDAADGDAAPECDYYGQPRITMTEHGGELVGQLADIGICEVMPRDAVSDIDLVPQSVRTTTNAVPGQLLFVKWTIANEGGSEVDAAWRDTVSLVSENGREIILGDKTTANRVAIGGSVFCSGYFTVPAIPEGTWYPKVNVNSYHDIFEGALGANNALVGERAVIVGLEALDPGVSRDGVVSGGTPTVLKLSFGEADENRMVTLDLPSGAKVTWGFGFMPQGASKSGATTAANGGVQFRVPDGATDVYVVIESDKTASYALSTETTKMTIAGVTPATLPSSGTTTLTINGAGFGEDCVVVLSSAVDSIRLQSTVKDASGALVATVDCATLAAGQTYDVSVSSGGFEATLPDAVSVTKAEGKGVLELEYSVPSSVRPGRVFTFTVTYRNIGNKDMCCPLIAVADTGSDAVNPIQFSLDGERFTPGGIQFVGTDVNGAFDALHPGDEVTLYVTAKIPAANNGSTAISVRANTESDIMSKYTTEIDRYLTPGMKAEFASTVDEELKAHGEHLAQVFGANNGEMVQNLAALAKRFYECNGFMLQKVDDLVPYGVAEKESESNAGKVFAADLSGTRGNENRSLLSASLDSQTGAYLYINHDKQLILDKSNALLGWGDELNLDGSFSLAGKRLVLISHGWNNSYHEAWVLDMADALSDTKQFDGIILVNWEKEASDYVLIEKDSVLFPRLASGHIPAVADRVAGQLNDLGITPELCTFIGHSFGSHLNAQIARRLNGRLYRHIGLDTADDWGINDGIEIRGNEADFMEFYRSSHLAGYDAPYVGCGYNYIVLDKNGFNRVAPLKNHSYSHTWFIENIKDAKGKNSGLGFWSDNGMPRNLTGLSSSGFAGVIYGPEHRLECTNHYGEDGFTYPGNRNTWEEMYHAWNDAVDLDIVDRGKVSLAPDSNLREGETVNVSFSIADNVDIKTINRGGWPYKYHLTGVLVLEGKTPVTVVDADYDTRTFNVELKVPKVFTTEEMQEGSFVFSVSARKGERDVYSEFYRINYSDTTELYPPDNSATIPVVILRSDLPFADINGNVRNDFVLQHPEYFETQEEYDDAVQQGKTFTYMFDGSKSKPGKGKSIVGYRWTENHGASNVLGDKATLSRQYSATAHTCYPIMLAVKNSQDENSAVRGLLQVEIRIGKSQPITQPRSLDPNEMAGPLGVGDPDTERFVKPGEWMTYTIYFENKTNATAAAQEVFVADALSEYLDWSTFEMGEISFGNQIDLGLVGKKNGTSEATMEGTNFIVRTTLEIEPPSTALEGNRLQSAAIVKWHLRIVDPTTDTGWPADIFAGFLPPNDPETHCGEGHLTYRVKVREDVEPGARIKASATIIFDYNDPIVTDPAWWNTTANIYEPTVELGDGTTTNLVLIAGKPYGELPAPAARAGHAFAGWFTGQNGTGRKVTAESIVQEGDAGLYAYWTPTTYMVKFNANGGKGTMANQTISRNVSAKLGANKFTKSGCVFLGWAKTKAGKVAYANGAAVKNLASAGGSVTLYAQWAVSKYTVKFNANGGTLPKGKKMAAQAMVYGKAAKLRKNVFVRKGHVFAGWATSAANAKKGVIAYANAQVVKNLTAKGGTVTLYAAWAKPTFKVAFLANGGSGKTVVQTFKYGKAARLAACKFKAPKGRKFAGWATSAANAKAGKVAYKNRQAVKNLVITGKTVKLYAVWKK